MKTYKFKELNVNFRKSFVASTLAQLGVRNESLLNLMRKSFVERKGSGSLFGETIYESMFPWHQAEIRMQDIPSSVLSSDFVRRLDSVRPEGLRIPLDRHPYEHQLKAWEALQEPGRSVLVTSGTGSGKTECFLIPILNDIYRKAKEDPENREGIQALFIYPLNALIESQKERMKAWSESLIQNGKATVRFGLYTRQTQRDNQSLNADSVEVLDRRGLWEHTPQLLVTNPTMLEYMLIRREDEAILKASSGKLTWIVVDEAHNYLGSSAAELSLLLRRVILAFNAKPENVHFIATSATIGSQKDLESLRRFLAGLAGVSESQVTVIEGFRDEKAPGEAKALNRLTLEELESKAGQPDFADLIFGNETARALRALFVERQRVTEEQLENFLQNLAGGKAVPDLVARWLDVIANARFANGDPFLPIRGHFFARTISGVWACSDANCRCRQKELSPDDWHFGRVYWEERKVCECGALVLPVVACKDTGQVALKGELHTLTRILKPFSYAAGDEEDYEIDRTHDEEKQDCVEDFYLWNTAQAGDFEDGQVHVVPYYFAKSGDAVKLEETSESAGSGEKVRCFGQDGFDDFHACPLCRKELDDRKAMWHLKGLYTGMGRLFSDTTSVMLKFCPPASDEAAQLPYEGRRFIAFADSRQGSARSAAILEFKGYKAFVQSAVIDYLAASRNSELTEAERGELNAYSNFPQEAQTDLIRERVRKLTEKQNRIVSKITWGEAKNRLRLRLENEKELKDSFTKGGGRNLTETEMAEVLLFREFWSLRTRWGSLETDGIVRLSYKAKETMRNNKAVSAPAGWPLTKDEWLNFLETCVDYIVRDRMAINADPRNWHMYGAINTASPRLISNPAPGEKTLGTLHWPHADADRQSRQPNVVIRYLADILGVDVHKGADKLNFLMDSAFKQLTDNRWLEPGPERSFYLDYDKQVSLNLNSGPTAFCPVKHWAVYHPIQGKSPWMAGKKDLHLLKYNVPNLTMSLKDGLFEDGEDVEKLRTLGVWQANYDSIADGVTYFKAVEHSAQQEKDMLHTYEADFKSHKINVMSCSTTMEMGVDIGGINSVVMTNVPPHPANYLQRVGRAGRRQEAQAVSLTICRNTPHDHYIFKSTDWAFTQPIPVPQIHLDSEPIMQRHINALLLSYYLKNKADVADIKKLRVHEWTVKDKDRSSLAQSYAMWLKTLPISNDYEDVRSKIASLLKASPFREELIPAFIDRSAAETLSVTDKVRAAIDAAYAQMRSYEGKDSRAYRALEQQVNKVKDENIIKWLSRVLYLPAHGFPVGTVVFDPMGDNWSDDRDLPSREAAIGIREYAPGSTVVINGFVYRSEGIIVDWKYEKNPKIRTRKTLYVCKACNGFSVVPFGEVPKECPSCHTEWPETAGDKNAPYERQEFLEPKGYTVAGTARATKDFSQKVNLPYKAPRISPEGEWRPLSNPSLGAYRTTNRGSIFYYDNGVHENGYALCLACGRASPMLENGEAPLWTKKPHRKLLADENGPVCSAGPDSTALQYRISFGREYLTDIFQLILFKENAPESLFEAPQTECRPKDLCYTTALALRRLAARRLGIREEELGCATQKAVYEGRKVDTVVIFDVNNAGYSCLIADFIEDLLRDPKLFYCPGDCETVCEQCLLTFDSRVDADKIQRRKTQTLFSESWLNALRLNESSRIFGESSEKEKQSLAAGILREALSSGAKDAALYLHGDAAEWRLSDTTFFETVECLGKDNGLAVTIVIRPEDWKKIDPEEAETMKYYTKLLGARVVLGYPPQVRPGGVVVATLQGNGIRSWGLLDDFGTALDASWGKWTGLLVSGESKEPDIIEAKPKWPEAQKGFSGQYLEISTQLDGPVETVGERFWKFVAENLMPEKKLGGEIASVVYKDRYVATPFVLAVVLYILKWLKEEKPLGAAMKEGASVSIETAVARDALHIFNSWTSDWKDESQRRDTVREAGRLMGLPLQYAAYEKRQTEHSRTLMIRTTDGHTLTIWLDLGFGFLHPGTRVMRDHVFYIQASDSDPAGLARKIRNCSLSLYAAGMGTRIAASLT